MSQIRIREVWRDEDADDLRRLAVTVDDGTSSFTSEVYVVDAALAEAVEGLDRFRHQIHGGIFDLRLGEFGPEFAGGAFHARLNFAAPGRLFITTRQESEFMDRPTGGSAAATARLYLRSEPALLDRWIDQLRNMVAQGSEAVLECV